MDPLSVTVSVVTLIKVTSQAYILLQQFCIDVGSINVTLSGLVNDVTGFQQVLEGMKETFVQDDIKANLTGHAGSHWKNLARSLKDGEETLHQLISLIEAVNKTTSFLDGPRKVARFKGATEQIVMFREQLQSYRAALELSLSTIILWNQVTFQKSHEKVYDQIIPSLDKLFDEFRIFGTSLNAQIEQLQNKPETQRERQRHQLSSLKNLRECVRSAADVASTSSTTLTTGVKQDEEGSVKYGSDLGDIFPKEPDEMMLRWMSSSTVYEDEVLREPDQSDSDSDIENEMIRALFDSADRLKEQGELASAEKKLRNCLSLFSEKSARKDGVTKYEILEALRDTYWMMESWDKAKTVAIEKMAITERQVGKKDDTYIWDTLKLAMLMMKCEEYVDAQLQGRRALQGFRRLKEPGFIGYEKSLLFLVELSGTMGKHDEQDAYATLLASHQAKQNATRVHAKEKSPISTLSTRATVAAPVASAMLPGGLQKTRDVASRSASERTGEAQLQTNFPPHPVKPVLLPARPNYPNLPNKKVFFGVSLEEIFRRDGTPVPRVVYQCILAVDLFGLEVEGIYRLTGKISNVQHLKAAFESDASSVDFRNPEAFNSDISSVTSLFKQFFRELSSPLVPSESYHKFLDAARIDDDTMRRDSVHALVNDLPDENYATLRALILHLHRVQQSSAINRMSSENLSICWASSIMDRDNDVIRTGLQIRFFCTLLDNVLQIFDED